ncbi:Protein kinase [Apophysomyces sp. BC1034]|nr:Protein kinase [Apophysomyces sp. BC1021]KAG0186967.1 Protein kinase [Apophysomyces sp. BC1034]
MAEIKKDGYLQVKEDGLKAWIWSKRYVVLREQTLTFHRNEQTGQCVALIFLKEINEVTRAELKPYCFEIGTKNKSYFIACKNDEELYSWMDEIYNRSPLGASGPTDFVHQVHVGFDPSTGAFTQNEQGLPDQWNALLKGSKITPEDAARNPQAVLEALEFYNEQMMKEKGAYDRRKENEIEWDEVYGEKIAANPKPSQSTPAPRQIREAPPRPPRPPGLDHFIGKTELTSRIANKDLDIILDKIKASQVLKPCEPRKPSSNDSASRPSPSSPVPAEVKLKRKV